MRSKYDGDCPLCGLPWGVGDPIAQWLGSWSHESCKEAERAALAARATRVELPEARGWADRSPKTSKGKPKRSRPWRGGVTQVTPLPGNKTT